jgi:hypothetical protein
MKTDLRRHLDEIKNEIKISKVSNQLLLVKM